MTSEQDDTPVAFKSNAPDPDELPSIRIYSHSLLFYWWPVWAVGFLFAGLSFLQGERVRLDGDGGAEVVHANPLLGTAFVVILLLVITFTTVRMRGLFSVLAALVVLLLIAVGGWAGILDDVLGAIPEAAVHMNMGFYLLFSTGLFTVWAMSFFIFDRLTYWSIRPGQMTEEKLIGDSERSYDTRGMVFEKHSEDYFRNLVLGLGAGDLKLVTSGAVKDEVRIENVLFVDGKVARLQRLIATKPDDLLQSSND